MLIFLIAVFLPHFILNSSSLNSIQNTESVNNAPSKGLDHHYTPGTDVYGRKVPSVQYDGTANVPLAKIKVPIIIPKGQLMHENTNAQTNDITLGIVEYDLKNKDFSSNNSLPVGKNNNQTLITR